ncbi:hypothetical protein CIHG_02836 [Coccidioides immitis H538.4]|uniref:Uncharacterized protein n=3 Tax=Coccidioides immitis TaxID=5501 RepID=A0A0J8U0J7_COCIT|nr:hypothetical protein CIRG_07548 [Coccidioides immitis RMSCC 2394]KMU79772.1 hypothetical protein CISG_08052 [Coccidioides immitis RMSCC 3703]KMU85054.1 hypothetical protein CIHG_02836 [Coccidioides immitis H538.4]
MDPLWTRRNANPSQDVTALLPRIKGRVVALEHGPKSGQLDLSPININHGFPRFGVRGWLDPWMYTPCLVCMYTEYCMLPSTLPLSDFQSQAPGNVFNDVTILDTNILRPHSQNNHSSGEKYSVWEATTFIQDKGGITAHMFGAGMVWVCSPNFNRVRGRAHKDSCISNTCGAVHPYWLSLDLIKKSLKLAKRV